MMEEVPPAGSLQARRRPSSEVRGVSGSGVSRVPVKAAICAHFSCGMFLPGRREDFQGAAAPAAPPGQRHISGSTPGRGGGIHSLAAGAKIEIRPR